MMREQNEALRQLHHQLGQMQRQNETLYQTLVLCATEIKELKADVHELKSAPSEQSFQMLGTGPTALDGQVTLPQMWGASPSHQ